MLPLHLTTYSIESARDCEYWAIYLQKCPVFPMMKQLRHEDTRGLHARRDFLRPQPPDSIPNSILGFCYQKEKCAQECWAEMFLAMCHFLVSVGYYLKPRVCVRACWKPFPPRGRKTWWCIRHGPKEPKYTVWHSNQGGNGGEPFTATSHQRWVNTGISSAKHGSLCSRKDSQASCHLSTDPRCSRHFCLWIPVMPSCC